MSIAVEVHRPSLLQTVSKEIPCFHRTHKYSLSNNVSSVDMFQSKVNTSYSYTIILLNATNKLQVNKHAHKQTNLFDIRNALRRIEIQRYFCFLTNIIRQSMSIIAISM